MTETVFTKDCDLSRHAGPAPLSARGEPSAKLHHDIRGVLSPALLAADHLAESPDPEVRQAATIICDAIEQTVALL